MTRPTLSDIVLTAGLAAAGVVLLLMQSGGAAAPGGVAVIKSVNDTTRVVSLSDSLVLTVDGALGETRIRVGGGCIEFLSSPCPHKICVGRGKVFRAGDYIVCVPNGVSARIEGESSFDAVVP